MTCPSSERCTDCTSPRPPQVSHDTGRESPLVPLPWQRSHNTAVSTVTCLVTPVAHSVRSSRIRSQIHVASGKAFVGVTMIEVTAVPSADAVRPIAPEVFT